MQKEQHLTHKKREGGKCIEIALIGNLRIYFAIKSLFITAEHRNATRKLEEKRNFGLPIHLY